MPEAQLIGLDVGTTSCKAGLFDSYGQLLALATASFPVDRTSAGWVEQDAERYWSAARGCLRELLASPRVDRRRLTALSSCGQSPTMVLLDAHGIPIRPAILWQDTRAVQEAEELARDPGTDVLAAWMDLRWPVDASLPLARLLWLKRHEPATLARTAVTVQPKDFVHLRLTGRVATDAWSSRGLVHQGTRRPIDAIRDIAGSDTGIVPEARRSREIIGHVTFDGAGATGLPEGLPVAAGWTDAMAAMLGTGAFGALGLAADVSGTSEVVGLSLAARPATTGPLLASPIVDSGRWVLYGPTQASGGSLGWALRTLGTPGTGGSVSVDEALAAAAGVSPGADGLIFLPYIEGERAPLWDPRARGAFIGLTGSHRQAHLFRAVLEGVACSIHHILSAAEDVASSQGARPLRAEEMRVAGGGARLALWNQIKADVTNRPVRPCTVTENGVLGAAMLAALSAGIYPDITAAGAAMVQLQPLLQPQPEHQAVYQRTFQRYTGIYPHLRDVFEPETSRRTE